MEGRMLEMLVLHMKEIENQIFGRNKLNIIKLDYTNHTVFFANF